VKFTKDGIREVDVTLVHQSSLGGKGSFLNTTTKAVSELHVHISP